MIDTLIVGGSFGDKQKQSGVVRKLATFFSDSSVINGGMLSDLPSRADAGLVIWMPNIDNEEQKHYPLKRKGTVLICSKVMREGYTHMDAISRIFKMHGNAVVAIDKVQDKYVFTLIDALGNVWYKGSELEGLADSMKSFYIFTQESIRIPTKRASCWHDPHIYSEEQKEALGNLISLNIELQDRVMQQCGNRFFGNISTRCQQLFPSMRTENMIYVSPRNSDKSHLSVNDMVLCEFDRGLVGSPVVEPVVVFYNGEKPSVDSPIQLEVYRVKENVRYMIHGHAILKDKEYSFWNGKTKNYRLCGDYREASEIINATKDVDSGVLTLIGHGFLMFAENIEQLSTMVREAEFEMKVR